MKIEQGTISQEYADAFGLEATTPEPSEGGAGEEPAENQNQEPPAGAESGESGQAGAEEPGDGEGIQEPAKPKEMDPEERHRQAAARRAREEQARVAAEQAGRDKIYADLFRGQVSPYTGKPITTEAEFRDYQAEKTRREQAAQLQQAGIQPETIQGIVDQQLAPIKGQLMQARMAAAQERARAVNAQAQEAIGAAVKNISAIYPEVKTLEDITAMPTAKEFNRLVQMGNSLEDAFYLANRKEIEARKIAAARTAAIHGAAGKGHLDPVPSGGGKAPVEVPANQVEKFREMMPGATDEEIRKAYAGFLKNIGK